MIRSLIKIVSCFVLVILTGCVVAPMQGGGVAVRPVQFGVVPTINGRPISGQQSAPQPQRQLVYGVVNGKTIVCEQGSFPATNPQTGMPGCAWPRR